MKQLRVRQVSVSELKAWEGNPRRNDEAVTAVVSSIERFGFNVPVLCDEHLNIIAGHTRCKAAQLLGLQRIPAIMLDMCQQSRRAFSIADNKTAQIAEWNWPALRVALKELAAEHVNLEDLGFNELELRDILGPDVQEDLLPEPGAKPLTKINELVRLGSHRLVCGNSADEGILEKLAEGREADLVFAGPPCFNQCGLGDWADYGKYSEDMAKVIGYCTQRMRKGGILVWHIANDSGRHLNMVAHHALSLEEAGLDYLDLVVWRKSTANYANPRNIQIKRNGYYLPASQWEALLVYKKPGAMQEMTSDARLYMMKHHTNVWDIANNTHQPGKYGHPAVCPVEIPFRCIQAYTGADGTVMDPFGGSGTTLIAAEKAGRTALLCERQPIYCDAAIARWETFTGKTVRATGRRRTATKAKGRV